MALDNDVLSAFFTKTPKRSPGARVFDEPMPASVVIKDPEKTEDKPEINRRQTEDALVKKPETQRKERDSAGEKLKSRSEPIQINQRQTEDSMDAALSYIALSGLQRKIANFIFNSCRYTRDRRTKPLSVENIATYCNINYKSIKKTIQRLEEKGILIRAYHKVGRGGWTQYELPDAIYYEIIHSQTEDEQETNRGQSAEFNRRQTEDKVETGAVFPNENTKLVAEAPEVDDYPFDIEELSSIGFTKSHLQQIILQKKLEHEVIQQSIYAFAFDLNVNGKAKKIKDDPLGYFMGILKKGIPYAPPANYEDPKIRGMRLYLEATERQKKKKEELEQQIIEIHFDEWLQTITDEQKRLFVDLRGRWDEESMVCRSLAKSHFKMEIWPVLSKGIGREG